MLPAPDPRKRTTMRLDHDVYMALKRMALQNECSMTAVINTMARECLPTKYFSADDKWYE